MQDAVASEVTRKRVFTVPVVLLEVAATMEVNVPVKDFFMYLFASAFSYFIIFKRDFTYDKIV